MRNSCIFSILFSFLMEMCDVDMEIEINVTIF